ncbi:unnamed protein product [Tilletia caries]|nr:unnamed protein product [Tilletia caries]
MFETRVQKFKAALAPLEGKVKVSYAKGKDNVVADALSRAPLPDRDYGEHDVNVCFRAVEFDGSKVRSASVEAERIVRAVSALRVGIDKLDLWEKGYLADPRWRRIWTKAVERGSAMEISGNEEEADSDDSGSSASEKGSDKEEGEDEGLVIEVGSDEGKEKTDAATKGSGDDAEEGAAVKEQEVADKPRPTHLLPTLPPIRVLRPRKVMAVHRGTDDSLFFIQDRLLFVKRRIGELAYELDVPEWFTAHPVLPITALEPFKGDPDHFVPRAQAGVAAEGGLDELRVKGFLGRRPTVLDDNGKFDYLVEWAGPAPTWQADTKLPGLRWAQRRFEKRARTELELRRLRQRDTIILPDGQARADALLAASQGA